MSSDLHCLHKHPCGGIFCGRHTLYFSTAKNITSINNKISLESLNYDKSRKQIVCTGYSPESGFSGLLIFNGNHTERDEIKESSFSPIQLYQYENTYLMNSAQVLSDGQSYLTELGFYDTNQKKIIKTVRIPGGVEYISGNGPKAYVSSYQFPNKGQDSILKKSNIYEFDLVTKEYRKIFSEDQDYVPFSVEYHDGYLYGVYQSALNVPKDAPQNLFVKIDLKTGNIVKKVQLSEYARDLVFSADGNYAYVTHFYGLFQDITMKNPITRIDLHTFEAKDYPGDYRAVSILEQNGKLCIGDDLTSKLTVLNEQTLEVEKTIQLDIAPIFLANESRSGKEHVQ
ncbi:YncE family protein [Collibacillus ludicampi]|nr:hypothetical protein [Collibacillus ludicampi]